MKGNYLGSQSLVKRRYGNREANSLCAFLSIG